MRILEKDRLRLLTEKIGNQYHRHIFVKIILKPSIESVAHTCSVKKVFLEILQNSQESTCARASILIKLQAICSKLTNKDTRTMPLALFWCLYC